MARREINLGTPNGKDGDLVRDAFNKANQNFLELYTISGGAIEDLTELAQDYAAQLFLDGDHVGITVTYQDDDVPPTINLTGFSGNYADLTNPPAIPAAQVNSDWAATTGVSQILNKPAIPAAQVNSDWAATTGVSQILNKPILATVATSGAYTDLTNVPDLSQYLLSINAFTGDYSELRNAPTLFSGSYIDLTDKPVLFSGNYADLTNKPVLFSGNYADLTNPPAIPASQVNSDWTATTGVSQILNKPILATVASSGLYTDLTGKPTSLETNIGAYNSVVLNGVSGTDELVAGGNVIIRSGTGGTDSSLIGSVVLQNGSNSLSFTGTRLVFSDSTEMSGSEIVLPEDADFTVSTTVRMNEITTNSSSMGFSRSGVFSLPSNGTIITGNGTWALDSANRELSFPNDFRIQYGTGFELTEQDVRLQSAGIVKIRAGESEWILNTTGVLTLPPTGDIQNDTGRSLLNGGVSAQVLVTSGSKNLNITDIGKHIYITGEEYIWVPHSSEVDFPLGTTISVVSKEAPITIQNSSSLLLNFVVLHVSGSPGTGQGYSAAFIPAYSIATLLKIATNTWMISGIGISV